MIKICYAIRIVAAVLIVGTIGSLDHDVIDLWTGFCQSMLGITLWILGGYWLEECKYFENEKVR